MISIVGFGRPKFKGAGASSPTSSAAPKAEKKTCPTCGQSVK
jgi:hypothetical protein